MLHKARYIVVEGPIGVGKTSLAERLADYLEAPTILERPQDVPFLAKFYQDMERHALSTQISFLLQRIDLIRDLKLNDLFLQRVVSDFLFEKDPLFAALNLNEDELKLYRQLFELLRPTPPTPDLVIYLQAEPETLIERVRRRGLGSERRLDETYLRRVTDHYARYFHGYDRSPLFIVHADTLNPVDRDEDFALLVERLSAMRGYREFFGYA